MPNSWWHCEKCGERCPPYTEVCRTCPPPPCAPTTADLKTVTESESSAEYKPNHIPLRERLAHLGFAIVVFGYAIYCHFYGECHIRSRRFGNWDAYGSQTVLFALALSLVGISAVSVVVDHYDKRNNERHYQAFARACTVIAAVIAIMGSIFGGKK